MTIYSDESLNKLYKFRTDLKTDYNIESILVLGMVSYDILGEIADVFTKTQEALGYRFYFKDESIIYYECIQRNTHVAYFNATGKRKLLDVMCRYADYIDSVFGPEPGKLKGYDGHQEIELALVRLYEATKNEKYLKLAQYFIDERGKEPYFFDIESEKRGHTVFFKDHPTQSRIYNQTHMPVREQKDAVGHAVRAVYMYTAMADIAANTGDKTLLEVCRTLWKSIVEKRMYITGAIGSAAYGEAFTFDYDLPNDTIYAETCASIGLIFFAQRMLKIEPKSEYADVMELALYNTVLSGMSQDGKSFFYVNPLEVLPEACEKNPARQHVKPVRQKWFGCSCCPPNVARLLTSLAQYAYTVKEDAIYTNLYIGGSLNAEINGSEIVLKQKNNYPWDGKILFELAASKTGKFSIALRIPGWCRNYRLSLNGLSIEAEVIDGYAVINREWLDGDRIELELDMQAEIIQSNPKVRANAGKVALQRGPLVYCLEEIDNGNNLSALSLFNGAEFTGRFESRLLGGAYTVSGVALRTKEGTWGNELYRKANSEFETVDIKFVPYFLWGNRQPGEMQVWTNYR